MSTTDVLQGNTAKVILVDEPHGLGDDTRFNIKPSDLDTLDAAAYVVDFANTGGSSWEGRRSLVRRDRAKAKASRKERKRQRKFNHYGKK